jgi:aryl-alcohol dehydrogenase-like predicted oxidoreductase
MQYSNVGGMNISKLTLGTVALGKDYGISNQNGKPSSKESFEMLNTALIAGINSIDTAKNYGNAEELVGEYFEDGPENINLVTKFTINAENLFDLDLARDEVYKSVHASRKLLRTNRIPILLFHKAADQSMDQLLDILPSIFKDLKHDGLIDVAGISVYYPDELELFCEHDIFQAFQVPMNLLDQRLVNTGLLPRLKADNKILFIRSLYLQGLFFMKPDDLKGNLTEAGTYLETLNDLAEQAGMSLTQLAFSYVRDTPGVTSIVFGAVNPAQVKQNVELLEGPSISNELRLEIERSFSDIPESIIVPGLWKV